MNNDSASTPFEPMGLDLPDVHPGVSLHSMLEFGDMSDDILLMLLDLPNDPLNRIIDLVEEYDDDAKFVLARVITTTAAIRDDKAHADVAGVLLHAAVVAPVYAAFNVPTDAVTEEQSIDATFAMMRETLAAYWNCTFSGLRLDATNRFYFARGFATHVMVSTRRVNLSWKNDKHFTWIGSRFDELKPHANEVLQRHDLTRSTLEEISMRWTVPYRLSNGSLPPQFEIDNYERLFSYDDFYSVIPEDGWEKMRRVVFEQTGRMKLNFDFRGVTLESEQHLYLQHFHTDINDASFMKLLSSLSDGTGKMQNGEAAMMMQSFGEGTIAFVAEATEDYSLSQKRLVSDALNTLAVRSEALFNVEMMEHFAMYVATAAPLLEEFFEHKDRIVGNDILDLLSAGTDWEAALSNSGIDDETQELLWSHIEGSFGVFHRVIDNIEVTPEKYTFLARGITAVHLIGYKGTVEEDEILFIGSHHDTILRNADSLRLSTDLSVPNLNTLARS